MVSEVGHRSKSKINTAHSLQPKTKTHRMHNKTVVGPTATGEQEAVQEAQPVLAHLPTTEAEEEAQPVLAHLPTKEAEEEAQTVLAPLPTREEVEEEAQAGLGAPPTTAEEEETPMIRTTVPRSPVAPQVSFRQRNQSEHSTAKESFVYLNNYHGSKRS